MSKLRAPLKPWLDPQLPERDVQRIWRKLQARPTYATARRRSLLLMAAGTLCALAIGGAWFASSSREPSPLALEDASALPAQRALGGSQPLQLALSDGSRIALERGAVLEVLGNSGREFRTRLQRGRSVFEVKPGGPRRWNIDCGIVSVEVVGTGFSIERSEHAVQVRVSHGIVAVRGARVPGHVQRLGAGQSLAVNVEAQAAPASTEPPATDAKAVHEAARDAREPTPAPSTHEAEQPRPRSAPPAESRTSTEAPPPAQAPADLSRLLREADAAREAGDDGKARAVLEQVLQQAPDSGYGALAAISLGRMQMASDPLAAAASLRAALRAGPPADLREDTLVRLVEAYARAGRMELARKAASEYRAAFPQGRRAAEVQGWVAAP